VQAKNLRHPRLFGAGALTFGLSYLFVVVLHLGAFALKAKAEPRGRSDRSSTYCD
jgi:hypothetical protein